MNGMLILKSNEIFYFFCTKSLKSSALSLVFYTSVQSSHVSTSQKHMWLMATM